MHADLINILASKRLVTWRPDISEKGLGSASQTDITFQWNFELKTSGKEDGKTKIVRKCSPDFVHFFFRFSPNFPNVKTGTVSITGRQMFARTLRKVKTTFCSNESLLRKMCRSAARLLRQLILHLLWQCPRNISYDISCVCVCVSAAIYRLVPCLWIRASQSINWQKCHNKAGSFEWHPSIHAKATGETVRRSYYLLMLQQGLKQLDSKLCSTLKHQEAERIKQTSGSTSSSLYGSSRKDCLPQCREAWRSSCSPFSNCHPAKSRLLTTQRTRKTY